MNNFDKIKNILQNFEVEYDPNDWLRLEKDLPKPKSRINSTKQIVVLSSIIITAIATIILLIYYFKNSNDLTLESKESNKKLENKTTISQKVIESPNTIELKSKNTTNNNSVNLYSTNKHDATPINNKDIETIKNNNIENQDAENTNTKTTTENSNIIPPLDTSVIKDDLKTNILDEIEFDVQIIDSCVPAKVQFIAKNIPEHYSIEWNTDQKHRITGNNVIYTYLEQGEYLPEANLIYNNKIVKTYKLKKISINKGTNIKINFDNLNNIYYFSCNNDGNLYLSWSIDNQQFTEKEVKYEFTKTGNYIVKLFAINKFGCKSEDSEELYVEIEHKYYVPNAFIPNNNDVNSYFGPIGENMDFVSYKMVIIDSNGNTVFVSDNPQNMWNGKINNVGEDAKPGIYLWEIKTLDKYGNMQTKKGRVTLIRN